MRTAVFCRSGTGSSILLGGGLFRAGPFYFTAKVKSVGRYPFVETFIEFIVVNVVLGFAAASGDGEDLGKAKFVRSKVVNKKLNSDSARNMSVKLGRRMSSLRFTEVGPVSLWIFRQVAARAQRDSRQGEESRFQR